MLQVFGLWEVARPHSSKENIQTSHRTSGNNQQEEKAGPSWCDSVNHHTTVSTLFCICEDVES